MTVPISPRSPAFATKGRNIAADLGESRELQIGAHEGATTLFVELESERGAGVAQAGFGDPCKILVAPHQTALPGVFELLGAPKLAQGGTLSRPNLLAQLDQRVHVEEGAVGVEHQGPEGSGPRRAPR